MLRPDYKLWNDSQCGPTVRFQSRYDIILASSIGVIPVEDVTASTANHPLHGWMLPQPCCAIVCRHCRMLCFGHSQRCQDAMYYRAVPL
jgi:hypothetical protein